MEVIRGNDLERKVWTFALSEKGMSIRLTSYAEETRPSKMHKFSGIRWNYMQRQSPTMPKPKAIPENVLIEAMDALAAMAKKPDVYIGFLNWEDLVSPSNPTQEGK